MSTPVDIAGLAFFRILFGICLVFEAQRQLSFHRDLFLSRDMTFTFWPFDFLGPIPQPAVKVLLFAIMLAGLLVALGLFYRVAIVTAFLAITYVFLLEKAYYLNHIYLVCLIAFLMIFLPAHHNWSLDSNLIPRLKRSQVPGWCIWLLRFQVGVPYFFAGIAKMSRDWIVDAQPLRLWLLGNRDFPLLGAYFENDLVVRTMALGSMLLDLSVPFLLLNKRTRVPAYAAALIFHLLNSRLFNIGIFPWMMIGVTLIFFPPEWPRKVLSDLRQRTDTGRVRAFLGGAVVVGAVASVLPREYSVLHTLMGSLGGGVLAYSAWIETHPAAAVSFSDRTARPAPFALPARTLVLLGVWATVQLLLPLRHLVIPGPVNWTEEGHRFSWHMLARDKRGESVFLVRDLDSGEQWRVAPREFLSAGQANAMTLRPDMVLQFAHYLRDRGARVGRRVEVKAQVLVSLNGAPRALLVDPEVDLAEVGRLWWGHAPWINERPPRA